MSEQSWIDRAGQAADRPVLHTKLKERRDKLRAAGLCINGTLDGTISTTRGRGVVHGPVVQGGRCARCHRIKTGGKS